MELRDIFESNLIFPRVLEDELNERLRKGIHKKVISGEQWFRTPNNWYDMPAYINPYKGVYDELPILYEHHRELKGYLDQTLKVFWGVGIADSECVPVRWDLQKNHYGEINAIDVIDYFLEGFIISLRNLTKEYPLSKIMFVGNNTLFETIRKENVKPTNTKYQKATHICFGNTIGNFDQEEIFQIFNRNIDQDDFLLLGYQLNKDPGKILSMYVDNTRFERLVLDPIDRGRMLPIIAKIARHMKGLKISWKYNYENDYVEAWLGDILVFRSKKYDPIVLSDFARQYHFESLKNYIFADCGVGLFQKI